MAYKSKLAIPAHPNTATHQLIQTREGTFWRAKRGLYTPVALNPTVHAHAEAMKRAAPAARRIAMALDPYTRDLQKGRMIAAISGRLLRCLKTEGSILLSALNGLELQPDYPLKNLLHASYVVESDEVADTLHVRIPGTGAAPVKARNRLADSYQISAILLYGDPQEDGRLLTQAVRTEPLSLKRDPGEIVLAMPLSDSGADHVLALRVECFEEGEVGLHPGLRAMKVIYPSSPV